MSGNGFSKLTYLKGLRGQRIPNGAYRVLVELFNYTDENGRNGHPGIARLANDCAMGDSTVRRHLLWLKDHGYLAQQSRGHNLGDVALASVYSLTLPNPPLSSEGMRQVATAQSGAATAQFEKTYRSVDADLPLACERLSDLSSDPAPDPKTSDPVAEQGSQFYSLTEWNRMAAEGDPVATEAIERAVVPEVQECPSNPPSRPRAVENQNRCTTHDCINPAIPGGRWCFGHLDRWKTLPAQQQSDLVSAGLDW